MKACTGEGTSGFLPRLPEDLRSLRVAIVHHWFVAGVGAERVTDVLARMFPQADLYALIADPRVLTPDLQQRRIATSFVQRIPGAARLHRHLLPLYPLALEQFDLRGYDLVISAESGPAKGVITGTNTCHLCLCHSPMRYLWDMYHQYRSEPGLGTLARGIFSLSAHRLRLWDFASAQRVDHFAAISSHVAARIAKYYRRDSTVIHPPLRVDGFIADRTDDHYLIVSRLVDYKRVDLAIEACNRLRRPLHVVGDGEQYKRLRRMAGPTVKFLGFLPDGELREQFARCRAFLFPGEEDLGATPAEAQSFGRPVIAYGRGGALDTVRGASRGEPITSDHGGVFFDRPTVDSLVDAMLRFEAEESRFSPEMIQLGAQYFREERFHSEFYDFVSTKYAQFTGGAGDRSPRSMRGSVSVAPFDPLPGRPGSCMACDSTGAGRRGRG